MSAAEGWATSIRIALG